MAVVDTNKTTSEEAGSSNGETTLVGVESAQATGTNQEASRKTSVQDPHKLTGGLKPGNYKLVKELKKDIVGNADSSIWPAVICDEEMVMTLFIGKKRPESAQEGLEHPGLFLPHKITGRSPKVVPLLLLGLDSWYGIWAPSTLLDHVDEDSVKEAEQGAKDNKPLRLALTDALAKHPLDHWKNKLKGIDAAASAQIRQESASEESDETEDGTNHVRNAPYAVSDARKRKRKQMKANDKGKRHAAVMSAVMSGLDMRAPGLQDKRPMPSVQPDQFMGQAMSRKAGADEVKIFVGPQLHSFFVEAASLRQSTTLMSKLVIEDNETFILWRKIIGMSEKEFEPIATFLNKGDYEPKLPSISRLNQDARDAVSVQCRQLYISACELEIPGLRAMAIAKFKEAAPYQPEALLTMVTLIFKKDHPDDYDFQTWLIEYTATKYYILMEHCFKPFSAVLQRYATLECGVFRIKCVDAAKRGAEDKKRRAAVVGEEGEDLEPERLAERRDAQDLGKVVKVAPWPTQAVKMEPVVKRERVTRRKTAKSEVIIYEDEDAEETEKRGG